MDGGRFGAYSGIRIILKGVFMKAKVTMILSVLCLISSLIFAAGQQEEAVPVMDENRPETPIEIYNSGYDYPTEKISLDYWHVLESRPGFHELAMDMADEYMKIHPNVTINIRKIPNSQQRTVWTAAFESHTAPDICWIETQLGLLNKGLVPAPEWAVEMMKHNFTPYALSLSNVNGTYYGWSGAEVDAGQMLYYRKDLFREAGLDPEKPPKTIEEMVEYAEKLTKFDNKGNMTQAGISIRYAGGAQGIGDKFSKYAAAFMDTSKEFFYNGDYSDVILDKEGWVNAAQLYHDLIFKYKVSNTTLPVPMQAFGQGLAAMTNRESFFAGWLDENFPDAEYGIAPLVGSNSYETGAMPWLALQGVSVDSKNPDVAWDFNMFMITKENEMRIVKNNGGFSRYAENQDDPYFKTLPYYDVYVNMAYEKPLVRNPYLDPNSLVAELEAKVGEVAVEMLTNEAANADKLMNDVAAYARKRLDEIK